MHTNEAVHPTPPRPRHAGRAAGLALALVLALPSAGTAQGVELSGFAGWRFGGSGRSPISFLETDIDGARSFGGTFSVGILERSAIELYFSRAEAPARHLFDGEDPDVTVSYLLLGIVHELSAEGIRPFVGVSLGGARLRESPGGSATLFAASGVLGVRYFPVPHVGLRADGRLLFVTHDRGRERSPSAPVGADISVTEDVIIQAELSVGLVLAF